VARFAVDYYVDPEALGITKDQSLECGAAIMSVGTFCCFSKDPSFLISLYHDYVSKNSEQLTEEQKAIAPECLQARILDDFGEMVTITEGPLAGKLRDSPPLDYVSNAINMKNILLPTSWILDNTINSHNKTNKEVLVEYYVKYPRRTYWAFGGNTGFSHDQTSSLSTAHRNAGVMILPDDLVYEFDFWSPLLPEIFDFTTGIIPPYIGSNHLAPDFYGPLKANPTKPCPISNLTRLEAETMCHSAQEAVWGTETLTRLESIKKAVDPKGMFDCFRCVGNKAVGVEEPTSLSPDEDESSIVADENVASEGGSVTDKEKSIEGGEYSSAAVNLFKSPTVVFAVFAIMMVIW